MTWPIWYNFVLAGISVAALMYGAAQWRRPPPENHFGRPTRIKSGAASRRKMEPNYPLILFAAFGAVIVAIIFVMIHYQVILEFHAYCCGNRPN